FQRFSHVASPGLGGEWTRLPSRRQRNDVVQQFRASFKKTPDIAGCLTNALLVFNESDADVAFPVLAKTRAGRNRNACLLVEQRGKLDTAVRLEWFGYGRQSEHGSGRLRQPPAHSDNRVDQRIARTRVP